MEDGHQSCVSAGENHGETLAHDHVVHDYARLPAWDVRSRGELLVPAGTAQAGHASRLIAVAMDERRGEVLQVVEIGC